MSNSCDVSVVILCYNHARFVVECLDSVKKQNYTDWELIIADDASKDNSLELISDWVSINSELKIKTNFHEINTGIGTMLNECIDIARGKYIKFISADDVLHPDFLTETVTFFEMASNEFGIVYTNAQYLKEDSTLENKFLVGDRNKVKNGWIRQNLQFSNFIPAPAVLIKKEVYQQIGKYNPKVLIDDFDCWLRASLKFKFHFIDKPLVYYRIHGNNISHKIDFGNDMIQLLINNDQNGDLAAGINLKIKDHYYQNNRKLAVLANYFQYEYREKWMSFCLQNKIPYKFYRLLNKIFGLK